MSSKIEIITGRPGQGKSCLAFHHARLSKFGVAIFDPSAQFDIGDVSRNPEDFEESLDGGENLVVYQSFGKVEEDFEEFHRSVFRRRELAVVIDEVHLLCGSNWIDENLEKLVRLARHKELDLFLTAHRPQDLNGVCYSCAQSYVFFHTSHPRDLEKIEAYTSPECAEKIKTLPQHHFVCWSVLDNEFYINTNPADWREQIKPDSRARIQEEVQSNG